MGQAKDDFDKELRVMRWVGTLWMLRGLMK